MKGKCRIKAIILIIQAQILFFCCTVGQTASVLCSALTAKTYPHSTLGDSVLCAHFLSLPEDSSVASNFLGQRYHQYSRKKNPINLNTPC